MKKLISFILVLSVMIGTSCLSTFAALDYTDTYYINGYELNGNVLMVDTLSSATTYCEKINYKKATALQYHYYYNHVLYYIDRGSTDTFVTNGFEGYSVDYSYSSTTEDYVGAIGRHKVKASNFMIWSSHASEDDSHVGSVVPDYSDI